MSLTSIQKPLLLLGHDLYGIYLPHQTWSSPIVGTQSWGPWIPRVQNLCVVADGSLRMLVGRQGMNAQRTEGEPPAGTPGPEQGP